MSTINCKNCGEKHEHHAKKMCYKCYRKLAWKPKKIICKRCGKEKVHHSQGYCNPCYSFLFHYDKIKEHNARKDHNIDLAKYRELTKKCNVCDFDKIVELHHLDKNKENNSETNLIGLCPNHHRLIHMFEHRDTVFNVLKKKGFKIPEIKY